MCDLSLLTTYSFPTKQRLGALTDGGYVIAVLDGTYDCYISAGVSNEESFSRDFINHYNMNKTNSFAFDGTIDDYPYNYTDKITYVKKNINSFNDSANTNLDEFIRPYTNVFIKMDIEGYEYPWLSSIDPELLTRVKQIVIEVHGLIPPPNPSLGYYSYSVPFNLKNKAFAVLANTHYLVHAHGNNCGEFNELPITMELTYVNKKYFTRPPSLNTTRFPIENLDHANNYTIPDFIIDYKPFCWPPTMENECTYVSSRGLAKSTDVHSRVIQSSELFLDRADYMNATRGSILYVCNSQVHTFARDIFPFIKEPFVLVSGDSDDFMPYRHFDPQLFKAFVEDARLQHWFCQNLIIKHPKMTCLPIGLDYHSMATVGKVYDWGIGSTPLDQEKMLLRCSEKAPPLSRRYPLCYSNFHHGVAGLRGDRQEVVRLVNPGLVFYEPTLLSRELTHEHQSFFSFVLSPAGGGPDCHRTWEALCLGCIPIVKTSGMDPLFEGLPVLIVTKWSDITRELLESTLKSFSEKTFALEKLTLAYWVGLFKNQSALCFTTQ